MSDEFKRLCDEYGLTKDCKHCWKGQMGSQESSECPVCDGSDESRPTLSDLLDMVEEKYPDAAHQFVRYNYDEGDTTWTYDGDTSFLKPSYGIRGTGETKKLAVLNALQQQS